MTTCTSCRRTYVAGQPCPARGDGAHTRRRPALPRAEAHSEAVRVRFTPAELRALDKLAARLRVSRAEAVRRVVRVACERPETVEATW